MEFNSNKEMDVDINRFEDQKEMDVGTTTSKDLAYDEFQKTRELKDQPEIRKELLKKRYSDATLMSAEKEMNISSNTSVDLSYRGFSKMKKKWIFCRMLAIIAKLAL